MFSSKEFKCGEEILTIAAMTSVQVGRFTVSLESLSYFGQDIFVIPEGAPGALAELERRKFTAEEGASFSYPIGYFTC